MRSKWDIWERRHWGGWNWLTCSWRDGNIKQTPQPTLVADSPKMVRINTERLNPFWEPQWLLYPSLPISWQWTDCLDFLLYIDESVCKKVFASAAASFVYLSDYGSTKMDFSKASCFFKWGIMNNNRLTKRTAFPVGWTLVAVSVFQCSAVCLKLKLG